MSNNIWKKKSSHLNELLKKIEPFVSSDNIKFNAITIIGISELISSCQLTLTEEFIFNFLTQGKQKDQINLESLEEKIRMEEPNVDPVKEWNFYIPINVNIRKRKFILLERQIKIKSSKLVQKEFNELKFNSYGTIPPIESAIIDFETNQLLHIKCIGNSLTEAWIEYAREFQILKGIIDFVLQERQWKFSSESISMTNFIHPKKVYAISPSNDIQILDFVVCEPRFGQNVKKSFSEKHLKNFNFIIRYLKEKRNSQKIEYLISECFRLYANAMDSIPAREGFIGFWQLAETIALSENFGGKTAIVAERLNWFAKETDFPINNIINTLENFAYKRNLFVHNNESDFNQNDLNILKLICERSILWIIKNSKKINTITLLETFYKFKSLNNIDLQARIEVGRFVLDSRTKGGHQ